MLIAAMLSILCVGALTVAYRVSDYLYGMWWWNAIPLVHAASLGVVMVVRRGRWMAALAVALVGAGLGGLPSWGMLAIVGIIRDPVVNPGINWLFWVYVVSFLLLIVAALRERAKSNREVSTWSYLGLVTTLTVTHQVAWVLRVFWS